jgi:hypothetical protein
VKWRLARASVAGSSHQKNRTECQDSHEIAVYERNGDSVLACVVSDGAGSASHSAAGSRCVCQSILSSVETWWHGGSRPLSNEDVEDWLFAASADISDIAEKQGLHPRLFACTVVGLVVWDQGAVYFQVGDGGIVVREEQGYSSVFWPQDTEALNLTYFITDEDWIANARIAISATAPDELAIFTDGMQLLVLDYVNRVAHAPFFASLFSQLRSYGEEYLDRIDEALVDYLSSEAVNARTDDDKTLVLAARNGQRSASA